MAFPKELAILGLCPCPLPPVLHASSDVPQCFSFTSAWKQQWFGELCGAACFLPCQLIAAPKAHSANLPCTSCFHESRAYCWGCNIPQRYLQLQFIVLNNFST